MTFARLMALGFCAVMLLAGVAVGQQGTLSVKDRKKLVDLATKLENEPLSKKAPKDRKKVLTLIRRAPDLTIPPCRDLLDELLLSKELGAQELRVQMAISGAMFLVQHPEAAGDRAAVYVAGVEGALRTYENMRHTNPLVQIESMDELLARREQGTLGEYVRQAMAACR
jgi:hypothetical protein